MGLTFNTGLLSDAIKVSSTLNVGIGTSSPASLLHLYKSNSAAVIGKISDANLLIDSGDYGNSTYKGQIAFGYYTGSFTYAPVAIGFIPTTGAASGMADLTFYTRSVTSDTAPSERMRITSSGNVGIGTSSPAIYGGWTGLDVRGGNGGHIIVANTADTNRGEIVTDGNGFNITALTNNAMLFKTNNTERMRITSGGDVSIGTTAASGKFNVKTTVGQWAIVIDQDNPTTQYLQLFRYNGTSIGYISGNNTNTTYSTSSDYRLKQDLKDFNGLSLVNQIKTYDFEWKLDKSRMYGVIAHELFEILPYAVVGEKDGEMTQAVDYSKIVPVLVKAIQEQQQQIEELKTLINK